MAKVRTTTYVPKALKVGMILANCIRFERRYRVVDFKIEGNTLVWSKVGLGNFYADGTWVPPKKFKVTTRRDDLHWHTHDGTTFPRMFRAVDPNWFPDSYTVRK